MAANTLSDRDRNILRALVREYVRTGKPVGSRRLAKLDPECLSPATIRNVVSDLEERGLVEQPHTSAGRIPTLEGYRLYVDALMEGDRLTRRDVQEIEKSLENETDPDELMTKTSKLLSSLTTNVGFVLAPPLSSTVIKRIEFLRIAAHRILVILVTHTGLVQHRIVQLDEDLPQADLDQAGRYLVTHFSGKSLAEARDELLALMSEEKALYDRMLRNVILLGSAGLMAYQDESESSAEVYFGGTQAIMKKPEMSDVKRMMVLFRAFEEKSRIVKIIAQCLTTESSAPIVTIGLEQAIPDMRDWAIVSSPYLFDQQVMGSLGIIGPSRMEYERTISLVDYVAKLFGRLMSHN